MPNKDQYLLENLYTKILNEFEDLMPQDEEPSEGDEPSSDKRRIDVAIEIVNHELEQGNYEKAKTVILTLADQIRLSEKPQERGGMSSTADYLGNKPQKKSPHSNRMGLEFPDEEELGNN
jgi:hypothetical protein